MRSDRVLRIPIELWYSKALSTLDIAVYGALNSVLENVMPVKTMHGEYWTSLEELIKIAGRRDRDGNKAGRAEIVATLRRLEKRGLVECNEDLERVPLTKKLDLWPIFDSEVLPSAELDRETGRAEAER